MAGSRQVQASLSVLLFWAVLRNPLSWFWFGDEDILSEHFNHMLGCWAMLRNLVRKNILFKKKKSQLRVSLVSRWYRLGAAIHFVRSNLQTVLQLRLFAQRACRQAHSRGHASPPTWTGVSVINSPKIHFSKLVIEPCDLSLKINTVALRGFSRRPALPFCFYWERWTGRKDLLCFVCMQMTGAPLGYCRERH